MRFAKGRIRTAPAKKPRTLRAAAEATTLERHVEAAVVTRMQLNGWAPVCLRAEKYAGNARRKDQAVEVGTADWMFWRSVKAFRHNPLAVDVPLYDVFWWEAKRTIGGKVRTSQRLWIAEMRKRGHLVIIASSEEMYVREYSRYFGRLR